MCVLMSGAIFKNQLNDLYTNAWAKHLMNKKSAPIEVMMYADFNPWIPKKAIDLYAQKIDKETQEMLRKFNTTEMPLLNPPTLKGEYEKLKSEVYGRSKY